MIKNIVVIYSGRFQPFHKGHFSTYSHLVSKFGKENVFIGSSNDTSNAKSPFNFKEKKKIATTMFPIPSNKFLQIRNPYKPEEILKKFDPDTTAYVTVVGEKDADRLKGKYFKKYTGNPDTGYLEAGYVYAAPAQPNPISGTDVRKNLGGDDMKAAKEFFSKRAYPKFDKDIFDMITKRLKTISETNNTKPSTTFREEPTPTRHQIEHPADEPKSYIKKYPYNPISEIIKNVIEDAEFYLEDIISEEGVMDKAIDWTDKKGRKRKSTIGGILKHGEKHPAYKQAKSMVDKGEPTPSPALAKADKEAPKPEKIKDTDTKQVQQNEPAPASNSIAPSDFKSSAETSPEQKSAEERSKKIKAELDSEMSKLSDDEKTTIQNINNPKSNERASVLDSIKRGISSVGKGLKHVLQHKKEMVSGSFDAVKSLSTTGKLGSIKDKDGKRRHWSEFASKTPDGKPEYEEIETDQLDSHGHPTGRKVMQKRPKLSDSANDEQKQLFEKSYKEDRRQRKALKGLAVETAVILGSIAVTGAVMGGVAAAKAGASASGIAQGALSKAAYKLGGGHLAEYFVKDVIKHSALEALGARTLHASVGGIGLGASGIFEMINESSHDSRFMSNVVKKTLEVMKDYKLSDEQMLDTIRRYKEEKPKKDAEDLLKEKTEHYVPTTGMFNRNLTVQQKIDKLNPARAIEKSKIWHKKFAHHNPETGDVTESKIKNINDFVEYATNRLNLNERPKVKLVTGKAYTESQSSLGGYSDDTKEIFVAIENRLTADILRTLAHEMAHRKQDEMGLITNPEKDGQTGSPIENKAHIVAGILMREYGKLNKKIFQEGLLKETSSISAAGDDAQPDGAYLPKGFKRKLGGGNGVNKSDEWFTNGGYVQIDFPEADAIFGDDDQDVPYVVWKVKNLPRADFKSTKFNNKIPKSNIQIRKEGFNHKGVSLLTEGGAYGHMSHPFDDMDLTFGDLKRIISGALNGHLELTREKTDGQALAISWKNGRLIAARNKGHLANAGQNAMGIEDVASKFAGRGGLSDAYNFAMNDLNAAISGLTNKQKEKIFKNGQCFMNLEVIWPESVNVIPYGQALLVFHNATCYNEKGEAISGDTSSARILAGMIKQINANVQSKYKISGPTITTLPKNKELSDKKPYFFNKLKKLQDEFNLSDSATVAKYHEAWWANFIDTNTPAKIDKMTKDALIRRWAFGDKSFRVNTISNEDIRDWATNTDKVNVQKQQRENIKPFEEIFLGVGSEVLQFVSSVITVHPDLAIRNMKDRLKDVAEKVKKSDNPNLIAKFKNELKRLNSLGGVDKIVAAEGIVFVYKDKTYKLTGTFAPLNQLLGIFYE